MMILRNGPLPNDPSREAPERVRKTHKDPETTHRLTKLPIDSKLKMNYEKQMRNANRRERAIVGADNVSDVSSYISIPEEEYDKIISDQPYFDRVKCWLSAHTLSWLADKRKQLRTRPRDSDNASPNPTTTQPLKRFRANDELNEVDPTARPFISFDQAFLDLGLHGYNVPLSFFTNRNVDFLNNNSISFRRTKISHIEGKPQILDLADVMRKMKDSRDAGTVRELELEHFEWIEATENFYAYQVSLYAEGTDAHEPIFYRKHFGFFENQVDSVKLYDLWKDIELEMRQKHQNKKTNFDLFDYRTEWGRVKSRYDALDAPTPNTSSTLRLSRFNNTKNQKLSTDLSPAPLSNSFPIDNKDKGSRTPCCIICGGVGHTYLLHNDTTHGPSKWAVQEGSDLFHPRTGARICSYWNIFSTCTKKCTAANHICTLCGGSHSALKWDPSCRVSRPTNL
ncbi:hypothetical protein F5890DRAFT_94436 [Lentinula detonsa]|uniref:Uncharacterized protein n=1 Tax=Lentinula detonsa TaxID=2804962 RepID=A0AA38PYI5_9AGAR|nr:hypothetical protein F5890DRAFT_94436 [Lentinula detonsa]